LERLSKGSFFAPQAQRTSCKKFPENLQELLLTNAAHLQFLPNNTKAKLQNIIYVFPSNFQQTKNRIVFHK